MTAVRCVARPGGVRCRLLPTDQFRAAPVVSSAPVLVAAVGMTLVSSPGTSTSRSARSSRSAPSSAGLLAKDGLADAAGRCWHAVLPAALLGAINGALVAGLGLPSIVVTLATMVIFREALRWCSEGESVSDLPDEFQWFGLARQRGSG